MKLTIPSKSFALVFLEFAFLASLFVFEQNCRAAHGAPDFLHPVPPPSAPESGSSPYFGGYNPGNFASPPSSGSGGGSTTQVPNYSSSGGQAGTPSYSAPSWNSSAGSGLGNGSGSSSSSSPGTYSGYPSYSAPPTQTQSSLPPPGTGAGLGLGLYISICTDAERLKGEIEKAQEEHAKATESKKQLDAKVSELSEKLDKIAKEMRALSEELDQKVATSNEELADIVKNLQKDFGEEIEGIQEADLGFELGSLAEAFCFPGETLIATTTADSKGNYHSVPISTVQPGDRVVSCNLSGGTPSCEAGEVLKRFERQVSELYRISLVDQDGKVFNPDHIPLRTTGNHPFYILDRKTNTWKLVAASILKTGDALRTITHGIVFIGSVVREEGEITVYNLEVKGQHNYYACGVLVHNCNGLPVAGTIGTADFAFGLEAAGEAATAVVAAMAASPVAAAVIGGVVVVGAAAVALHAFNEAGEGDSGGGQRPPNMAPEAAGREGAFKAAKKANGIPTSQQPDEVLPNVDKRGNTQPGRRYIFNKGKPNETSIRDDAGGHSFGAGDPQNRGPHFNDPIGNHYDY